MWASMVASWPQRAQQIITLERTGHAIDHGASRSDRLRNFTSGSGDRGQLLNDCARLREREGKISGSLFLQIDIGGQHPCLDVNRHRIENVGW